VHATRSFGIGAGETPMSEERGPNGQRPDSDVTRIRAMLEEISLASESLSSALDM